MFQLLDYQQRYLEDRSLRKLVVKSRRIGFSWVAALETACDAIGLDPVTHRYDPEQGIPFRVVSATESQSRALLADVAEHLAELERGLGVPLVKKHRNLRDSIELRNGQRIEALTASPRRMRGGKGGLLLDEFAAFAFADDVWTAAAPSTRRHIGRDRPYPLRIVSTPLGDANKFYRLARTGEGRAFSVHEVSIHEAIAAGFPEDWEEICDDFPDPEVRAQEFELSFLAASSRLISEAAFDACIYDALPPTERAAGAFAGYDVARKATGDHAAAVYGLAFDGTLWVPPDGVDKRRGVPWDDQEAWIGELAERCLRVVMDGTGIGMQMGERMSTRYGNVEALEFTTTTKAAMASETRRRFATRTIRVPLDHELRRSVLSIRREYTNAGNELFSAPRSRKHGHADLGWATAMMCHAARDEGRIDPGAFDRILTSGMGRLGLDLRDARRGHEPAGIGERRQAAIRRNRRRRIPGWRR